jgi:hypothetical protein
VEKEVTEVVLADLVSFFDPYVLGAPELWGSQFILENAINRVNSRN